MATNIPVNSPLAKKAYSVGLFTKVHATPGFMNLLSGEMPKDGSFGAKIKGQTSADYPIVKAGDLGKEAGDAVTVDLFNALRGKPVMGDRKISGRMMPLTSSSMDISINQTRGGVDTGGRMTQKRTVHNLRGIALNGLQSWMQKLEDQNSLVHLAGARGTQMHADWVVPHETDPEFAEIMVNPIKAPTKNRHYFANDATSPADIGTNDVLSFQDIERIVSLLKDSTAPLQSIKIKNDERAWDNPLWAMFVTNRQWLYLKSRTSDTTWREAAKSAYERKGPGIKHPLFNSFDAIMWDGLLIRPINRYAIRFDVGDNVKIDGGTDGTFSEQTVQASQPIDRAIIVGAQALAKAYGKSNSDYYYDWSEEKVDHGNAIEIVAASMGGTAKVRFKIDGIDTDHGVAVVDSYAPDPASSQGIALLKS